MKKASSIIPKEFFTGQVKKKLKQYNFFPLWEEIVGIELAKVTKPKKIIRNHTLIISVLDSSWAQELSFKKAELLDTLLASGRTPHFSDIQFVSGSVKDFK
jgi:predicted nucleic acid-binding Zn ribbon protein